MILITGASRGIGASIATSLERQGKPVFRISRDNEFSGLSGCSCDVSSEEQVKQVSKFLKKQKISVDALINCAGVASMNIAMMTPASVVRKLIGINLLGTIFCCQSFAPLLIANGGRRIINFSTIAVALGLAGESAYVASKAGVEGFSRTFAREVSSFGITVNCIAPGPIKTDLLTGVSEDQIDAIVKQQILKQRFSETDICNIVDLLLDQKSSSITGQVLHVGGV